MRLTDLGWSPYFQSHFQQEEPEGCVPARVSGESKGFYRVLAEEGEFLAQIAGRIRYRAEDRDDLPAVGDWVVVAPRPAESRATILAILPRRTVLSRKEFAEGGRPHGRRADPGDEPGDCLRRDLAQPGV